MEMPDSPSEEENTDEGFVGHPPLPRGIKPQPISRCYEGPNRGGKRLSWRDWLSCPVRPPERCADAWVPPRPSPVAHLAKMQDFQGEESKRLDAFFDHIEELADFYRWDGRETCR